MVRLIAMFAALLFPSAALAQAPAAAQRPADCQIRIVASPTSWIIQGFDPFASSLAEGTYSVTFTNESAAECTFTPVFDLLQPPFGLSKGGANAITYAILNLSDAQDVTPRSGRTLRTFSTREIVLGSGEVRSVLYKLIADADDIQGAGTFTQDVTIEAQDRQRRSLGGTQVVLGLNVLPSARIGLAGAYSISDGQAVVNLGDLREGVAPVPLRLRVSSTGKYDISVSSANSGRLRLGGSEWTVPYTIAIGGNALNLNGLETFSGPEATGFRRDAMPIEFIIGDVANKRAGSYSDTISISVAAR